MYSWLPLQKTLLNMTINHLPSPVAAMKYSCPLDSAQAIICLDINNNDNNIELIINWKIY